MTQLLVEAVVGHGSHRVVNTARGTLWWWSQDGCTRCPSKKSRGRVSVVGHSPSMRWRSYLKVVLQQAFVIQHPFAAFVVEVVVVTARTLGREGR